MLQACFSCGRKGLVYLEMTCTHLRNDSTEERSNSAFLTKILASKLPISRTFPAFVESKSQMCQPCASEGIGGDRPNWPKPTVSVIFSVPAPENMRPLRHDRAPGVRFAC